jgi:hypothetical protein
MTDPTEIDASALVRVCGGEQHPLPPGGSWPKSSSRRWNHAYLDSVVRGIVGDVGRCLFVDGLRPHVGLVGGFVPTFDLWDDEKLERCKGERMARHIADANRATGRPR